MKSVGDNLKIFIGNKIYNHVFVFCDICGSGNKLKYENVLHNNRNMDFCDNHSDDNIINFIEMNLDSYSVHNPIKSSDLKKKQFNLKFDESKN